MIRKYEDEVAIGIDHPESLNVRWTVGNTGSIEVHQLVQGLRERTSLGFGQLHALLCLNGHPSVLASDQANIIDGGGSSVHRRPPHVGQRPRLAGEPRRACRPPPRPSTCPRAPHRRRLPIRQPNSASSFPTQRFSALTYRVTTSIGGRAGHRRRAIQPTPSSSLVHPKGCAPASQPGGRAQGHLRAGGRPERVVAEPRRAGTRRTDPGAGRSCQPHPASGPRAPQRPGRRRTGRSPNRR